MTRTQATKELRQGRKLIQITQGLGRMFRLALDWSYNPKTARMSLYVQFDHWAPIPITAFQALALIRRFFPKCDSVHMILQEHNAL